MTNVSATCLLVMIVTAPAIADDEVGPTQRADYFKRLNEEYQEYLADLNAHLEVPADRGVGGEYIQKTFPDRVLNNGGTMGLTSYLRSDCTSGVQAARDLVVESANMKKAIGNRIKRIDCAFGGKTKDKFGISLVNGRMTVTVAEDVNGATTYEQVVGFLRRKM
jgi:hypothetical protein